MKEARPWTNSLPIRFVVVAAMCTTLAGFSTSCAESGSEGMDSLETSDGCGNQTCDEACVFVGYSGGVCLNGECQCVPGNDESDTDPLADTGDNTEDDTGDDTGDNTGTDPIVSDKQNIITFHTNRDSGDYEIYIANGDGGYVTRVTTSPGRDLNPNLSPDGEFIVFDSARDGYTEIYLMRRDGSQVTRLTNNHKYDEQPIFSPDGKEIAFVSNRDGNKEIYTMKTDGTAVTRLTNENYVDEYPIYSPDGSKIFFVSTRDEGHGEIYSMNSKDGTQLTRLTNNREYEKSLSISPDGTRVVFSSNMDGTYELYTMNASNGTGLTRLTKTDTLHEQWPSWSADGSLIYYSACWHYCNVYSIGSDGNGISQLTDETRSEHPSTANGRPVQAI